MVHHIDLSPPLTLLIIYLEVLYLLAIDEDAQVSTEAYHRRNCRRLSVTSVGGKGVGNFKFCRTGMAASYMILVQSINLICNQMLARG